MITQNGVLPPVRDEYAIAYNPASNSLVLAGGYNANADVALNGKSYSRKACIQVLMR